MWPAGGLVRLGRLVWRSLITGNHHREAYRLHRETGGLKRRCAAQAAFAEQLETTVNCLDRSRLRSFPRSRVFANGSRLPQACHRQPIDGRAARLSQQTTSI